MLTAQDAKDIEQMIRNIMNETKQEAVAYNRYAWHNPAVAKPHQPPNNLQIVEATFKYKKYDDTDSYSNKYVVYAPEGTKITDEMLERFDIPTAFVNLDDATLIADWYVVNTETGELDLPLANPVGWRYIETYKGDNNENQ